MSKTEFKEIDLDLIFISKTNPRKHFEQESINELANSIKEKGVIQPIVVRKRAKSSVELVCGERRYRASKIAGKKTIPCIVRELSDEEAFDLQIIENLQRKDVHPMDEAVAFQSLQIMKKFDIDEISKRVAKSTTYVAQRLKLNELIEEFQKAFFDEKMKLGTALELAKFRAEDQKEMWEVHFSNSTNIKLEKWISNKYSLSLKNASFDIKDENLSKSFGSCIGCNYNSASHMLLFPDADKDAICLNGSCFKSKVDKHFQSGLDKAINDPGTVLIMFSSKHNELSKSLVEKGNTVYLINEFEDEEFNDEEPNIEDYKEELEDNWYPNEQEMMEAYNNAMTEYTNSLAEHNKKLLQGLFLKGYCIDGNRKGKTIPITLKSNKIISQNTKEAGNSILFELVRLDETEARRKELDEEKIHLKVFEVFREKFETSNKPLVLVEQIAFIISLASQSFQVREFLEEKFNTEISYRDYYHNLFQFISELSAVDVEGLTQMIMRVYILEQLAPVNGAPKQRPSINGKCAAIRSVANIYIPETVGKIELEQKEITDKRVEKYNARKTQLEKQVALKK